MSKEEGRWDFLKLAMGLTEVPHIWPAVSWGVGELAVRRLGPYIDELKASI